MSKFIYQKENEVRSKKTGLILGRIKYDPEWKKHVFVPLPHTIFDDECLRDIVGWIRQRDAQRPKDLEYFMSAKNKRRRG